MLLIRVNELVFKLKGNSKNLLLGPQGLVFEATALVPSHGNRIEMCLEMFQLSA